MRRWKPVIRARAGEILDKLPRGETFDWVDRVSVELTTQMLATLFDFPWEDRQQADPYWSDVATAGKNNTEVVADRGAAARRTVRDAPTIS